MPTKFYRYTLEGEHSTEDAQRKIGSAAAESLVLRVEYSGGRTQLYVASQEAGRAGRKAAAAKTAAPAVKVEEVSEKEVTTIRSK